MDFLDTNETRYHDEPMKMAQMRYSGKRFRVKPRPIKGRINATRSYLSRTLTEWMMKCV